MIHACPSLLFAEVEAPAPIGTVLVVADGSTLVALEFGPPEDRLLPSLRARFGPDVQLEEGDDPGGLASATRAYFAGDLAALAQVPVEGGGSAFQRRVWAALREIPAGETRSYGQIAARLGQPRAARAVGLANSLNPVSVAVPCHRVIGGSGALIGYGGGIERKRWLLAHERQATTAGGELPLASPRDHRS